MNYRRDPSDADFMLYCFFEGMLIVDGKSCLWIIFFTPCQISIRYESTYKKRWCDYADGLLSLSVVSVVTDTAIDIFQWAKRATLKNTQGSRLRQFYDCPGSEITVWRARTTSRPTNWFWLEQLWKHALETDIDFGIAHVDYIELKERVRRMRAHGNTDDDSFFHVRNDRLALLVSLYGVVWLHGERRSGHTWQPFFCNPFSQR